MWNRLFPLVYEKYLAKQIYWAFTFVLFALTSLFLFFDFISELSNTNDAYSNLIAFVSVLLKMPSRMVEIMPIATLIAGIYTLASMASQSEFTALRVGGLNTGRAIKTLIKIAIPIGILILLINETVGPVSENLSKNIKTNALYSGVETLQLRSGAWIKDNITQSNNNSIGTRYINIGSIETSGKVNNMRIFEIDKSHRLVATTRAEKAFYSSNNKWVLENVTETRFIEHAKQSPLDPNFSTQITNPNQISIHLEISPELLNALLIKPERLSILDLFRYIFHLKKNDQDYQRYAIWLWKKVIYPFTVVVMLILALPFAYVQSRSGGLGLKVFGGIMLGISFLLLNSLISHIGLLQEWPSWLASITPTILYLCIALFAIKKVSRV